MLASDKEVLLILAKALNLSWATAMALLFLGAPDYRIATKDLSAMKVEFARLDVETSRKVLRLSLTQSIRGLEREPPSSTSRGLTKLLSLRLQSVKQRPEQHWNCRQSSAGSSADC